MGIKEKNTDQMNRSRIITLSEFYGANSQDSSDTTGVQTGFGAGNPILTEVGTFGFGAGNIAADGDTFTTIDLQTPRLINPDEEVGVRVWYMTLTSASVATDDITWVVTYDTWNDDEALVNPATACNTPIAEHRAGAGVVTPNTAIRSPRGIINPGSFTWENRGGGVTWEVSSSATDYNPDELAFIGLEIDYVAKWCKDGNEDVEYFRNLAATS